MLCCLPPLPYVLAAQHLGGCQLSGFSWQVGTNCMKKVIQSLQCFITLSQLIYISRVTEHLLSMLCTRQSTCLHAPPVLLDCPFKWPPNSLPPGHLFTFCFSWS